jgi:hypothetical protein
MKITKTFTAGDIITIAVILVLLLFGCSKVPQSGHECRWTTCPYKGVQPSEYVHAVLKYVGNDDSFDYQLDILHLKYPKAEYDELEEKMLTP